MQYNVWRNFTTLLLLSLFNFHDFDNSLLSFLCNLPGSPSLEGHYGKIEELIAMRFYLD
jgi:hypothetical protein